MILPDIKRVVGEFEERVNARFDDVNRHFDAIYQGQIRVLEERLAS